MRISPSLRQRLQAKSKPVDTGCILWQGVVTDRGYGRLYLGTDTMTGKPVLTSAHRAAWYVEHGTWPDVVMHVCDVRICVNPAHLRAGTQLDNMRDMRQKGRGYDPSQLDYFAVREAETLRASGWTLHQIAEAMDVGYGPVWRALRGVQKPWVAQPKAPKGPRGRKRQLRPDQIAWACEQRQQGRTLREIAAQLGVSIGVVHYLTTS